MPISPAGLLNTTALVVPGLYVQIVPPQNFVLNGVPSGTLGVVGTASWGPVGIATEIGTPGEYLSAFGPVMPRSFDMGTYLTIATQQGAAAFECVRVTDGTDTKATGKFGASTADDTFTAIYSGTAGNATTIALSASPSVASAWNCTISNPILGISELFQNITGTAAAFWANLANAINNGQSITRGPSQLITVTDGTGTDVPSAESVTLSNGTDGVTTITASVLIGLDTAPRKGMYALRGQGASVAVLCDLCSPTSWSVLVSFGLSEGIYMVDAFSAATGLPTSAISTSVTTLQTSGAASYALKVMFGDWCYWQDQQNNVMRLISPAAFAAGKLAATSPQNSTLNSQLFGIAGTQQLGQVGTSQSQGYAQADLQALFLAGIDVISNPSPGGAYFSCLSGYNTGYGTNPAVGRDTYTRMTNYIAATLNAGMGIFIGGSNLIGQSLMQRVTATLTQFLNNLLQQGLLIMTVDGNGKPALPFNVTCANSNNPPSRTSQGYLQADVNVQYGAINEKFIVNLQGGQTVQVTTAAAA